MFAQLLQLRGCLPPSIRAKLVPLVADVKRTKNIKIHQIAMAVIKLFPRASDQQAKILTLYVISEANVDPFVVRQPPVSTPVIQADLMSAVFSDSTNPTISADTSFSIANLTSVVADAATQAQAQLQAMQSNGESISVVDMFQMQMLMNQLSQISEMATNVVSASNSAMMSIARNIKS
jgi:hypothetical protein